MTCSGSATIQNDFKDCVCPLFSRIIEDPLNNTKTCFECNRNAYQGQEAGLSRVAPVYECLYCPSEKNRIYNSALKPWSCQCNPSTTLSNGVCYDNTILRTVLTPEAIINYESSENSGTLTRFPFASGTIQYLYYDAALGCYNNGDPQKCQTLANLCVLVLYDETTNICKQFKDIVQKWSGNSGTTIAPSGTQPI
jgi:hypothetical protein